MSKKMLLAVSMLGMMFGFGGGCLQTAHQVVIHGSELVQTLAALQTLGT